MGRSPLTEINGSIPSSRVRGVPTFSDPSPPQRDHVGGEEYSQKVFYIFNPPPHQGRVKGVVILLEWEMVQKRPGRQVTVYRLLWITNYTVNLSTLEYLLFGSPNKSDIKVLKVWGLQNH